MAVQIDTEAALLQQRGEVLHIHFVNGVVTHHHQPVLRGNAEERGLQPVVLHAAALGHDVLVELAGALEVIVVRVDLKTKKVLTCSE